MDLNNTLVANNTLQDYVAVGETELKIIETFLTVLVVCQVM